MSDKQKKEYDKAADERRSREELAKAKQESPSIFTCLTCYPRLCTCEDRDA